MNQNKVIMKMIHNFSQCERNNKSRDNDKYLPSKCEKKAMTKPGFAKGAYFYSIQDLEA